MSPRAGSSSGRSRGARAVRAEEGATLEESLPLPAVEIDEVASQYLDDAAWPRFSQVLPAYFAIDMGIAPPSGGAYEVRRTDQGWSTGSAAGSAQNVVGTFSAQIFLLPRTARRHPL